MKIYVFLFLSEFYILFHKLLSNLCKNASVEYSDTVDFILLETIPFYNEAAFSTRRSCHILAYERFTKSSSTQGQEEEEGDQPCCTPSSGVGSVSWTLIRDRCGSLGPATLTVEERRVLGLGVANILDAVAPADVWTHTASRAPHPRHPGSGCILVATAATHTALRSPAWCSCALHLLRRTMSTARTWAGNCSPHGRRWPLTDSLREVPVELGIDHFS